MRRRVFPHLLRNSLAVSMLLCGAPLRAVKDQLGHFFVETTMIYFYSGAKTHSATLSDARCELTLTLADQITLARG